MKLKRSLLWFSLAAGLLWLSGGLVQAHDEYDRRDPIRSARAGVRQILTLAQGSVFLDVKPKDAEVFVDRRYFGIVRDFNDKKHPLFLYPGRHVIELRHPKYEPYIFPVQLAPEQDVHIKYKLRKY